ncbi:hypothetical protein C0992_000062 [Termitomyces sp. T32_za158]|nr:hypothetical protein C0992_000062 [Termitomyces sp. T32_za158]
MVKHLPPSIKYLLKLRHPDVLPSPPLSKLNALFARTSQTAKLKNAETGWLVLAYPDMPDKPDSRVSTAHAVNKAALMRESALKSTIFVGVPRAIQSLAELHGALDDDVKQALRSHCRRLATPGNIETTVERGKALWNSIYTPHADKLHDKLGTYHPDLISFIIQSYGTVLSPLPGSTRAFSDESGPADPDQGNLSQALGSVVGIATLRTEGRVGPQLTSHTFGLLKARHLKGLSAEDAWLSSDEGTEWVLRTVDEFLDVISEDQEVEAKVKL